MADEEQKAFAPVTYTSHPIPNYSIGRFQFEKATMTLDNEEDVAEFEKLYATLPMQEKARVQKIDLEAAEGLARQLLDRTTNATQQIDSSVGDRPGNPPKPGASLESLLTKQNGQ